MKSLVVASILIFASLGASAKTLKLFRTTNMETKAISDYVTIEDGEKFFISQSTVPEFKVENNAVVLKSGDVSYVITELDASPKDEYETVATGGGPSGEYLQRYENEISLKVIKEKKIKIRGNLCTHVGCFNIPTYSDYTRYAVEIKLADGSTLCLNDDVIKNKERFSHGKCK